MTNKDTDSQIGKKAFIWTSRIALIILFCYCFRFLYKKYVKSPVKSVVKTENSLNKAEMNDKLIEIHSLIHENQENEEKLNAILIYTEIYKNCIKFKGTCDEKSLWKIRDEGEVCSVITSKYLEDESYLPQFKKNILSLQDEYIAKTYEFSTCDMNNKIYYIHKFELLPYTIVGKVFDSETDEYLMVLFNLMKGLLYLYKQNLVFLNFSINYIRGENDIFHGMFYKIVPHTNLIKLYDDKDLKCNPYAIEMTHIAPEIIYRKNIKLNHDIYPFGSIAYYLTKDFVKHEKMKAIEKNLNICYDCYPEFGNLNMSYEILQDYELCEKCIAESEKGKCVYCPLSKDFYDCEDCVGNKDELYSHMLCVRNFQRMTLYNHPVKLKNKELEEFINVCLQNGDKRPNIVELINMNVTKKLFKELWYYF